MSRARWTVALVIPLAFYVWQYQQVSDVIEAVAHWVIHR